ncbi:transmembrane protein 272-like [Asterias rubens]|uniref:transmembrane protein 272-like n=1 Tax=Asterias rubens TaxID=7604 RepID=UPI00145598BB|nr:transmembrane protein 272-like [Asterias rubens]XP_033632303.1 transmembrane protein 272-like [Asterias rubens]XP_033632304.1 transmembrane protein 272-like [Asterias rubens]
MDGNKEKNTSSMQLASKDECNSGPTKKPIFLQIQDAKTESDNNAKYAGNAAKIMGSHAVILLPFFVGLPIAMLINGAIHLDECPVEPYIPIYMIVQGSLCTLQIMITHSLRIKRCCEKRGQNLMEERTTVEKVIGGINSLIGLVIFAFFIAGNIWVFRVLTPNTTDPTAVTYCRHSIYWFTFGTIVAVYGLVALGIVLCCCCCCVAAFKVGKTPEMYNH